MKLIENLNYRQWQERNSSILNQLTKPEQKEIRKKGYHNIGWDKVQRSWLILKQLKPKVVSIFDYKLSKNNLIEAIDIAIIDTDNTHKIAKKAIENIKQNKARLNKLAEDVLSKYKLL